MRKLINIIKAEFLMLFGDMRAYWINYVFDSFNSYMFILGLFLGMRIDDKSSVGVYMFIIGILMWRFSTTAIQSVSGIIQSEIRQGTMEQLFMTESDISIIIFGKLIARFIFDSLQIIVLLGVCIVTFGQTRIFTLDINIINLIVVLLIFNIALWGIGYITAGLSLIYKKAQAVARATTNFILFFSGILEIGYIPEIFKGVAKIFPFYWGAESVRVSTVASTAFKGIMNIDFLMLIVTSVIFVFIGIIVFKKSVISVLRAGSLSQY